MFPWSLGSLGRPCKYVLWGYYHDRLTVQHASIETFPADSRYFHFEIFLQDFLQTPFMSISSSKMETIYLLSP